MLCALLCSGRLKELLWILFGGRLRVAEGRTLSCFLPPAPQQDRRRKQDEKSHGLSQRRTIIGKTDLTEGEMYMYFFQSVKVDLNGGKQREKLNCTPTLLFSQTQLPSFIPDSSVSSPSSITEGWRMGLWSFQSSFSLHLISTLFPAPVLVLTTGRSTYHLVWPSQSSWEISALQHLLSFFFTDCGVCRAVFPHSLHY